MFECDIRRYKIDSRSFTSNTVKLSKVKRIEPNTSSSRRTATRTFWLFLGFFYKKFKMSWIWCILVMMNNVQLIAEPNFLQKNTKIIKKFGSPSQNRISSVESSVLFEILFKFDSFTVLPNIFFKSLLFTA
jgi:hypothetical protein